MIFYGAVQKAPALITDRAEKGVFKVIADDKISAGFAIAGGKFLLTCDHVIGHDSKIKIEDSLSGLRNGYLVFHDSQLNVAVYRMDRPSSVSFVINSNSVKPGTMQWLAGPKSRFSAAEMTGIKREGDTAFVLMKGATTLEVGSPFLNSKGEVIGMFQQSDSAASGMMSGISGYNLTHFLKAQSAPPSAPTVIGSLGQVL
ncbi:MAG: serine protease, partial [Armatimonadota bacterium]